LPGNKFNNHSISGQNGVERITIIYKLAFTHEATVLQAVFKVFNRVLICLPLRASTHTRSFCYNRFSSRYF